VRFLHAAAARVFWMLSFERRERKGGAKDAKKSLMNLLRLFAESLRTLRSKAFRTFVSRCAMNPVT
jgi:hypothetical protein